VSLLQKTLNQHFVISTSGRNLQRHQ